MVPVTMDDICVSSSEIGAGVSLGLVYSETTGCISITAESYNGSITSTLILPHTWCELSLENLCELTQSLLDKVRETRKMNEGLVNLYNKTFPQKED